MSSTARDGTNGSDVEDAESRVVERGDDLIDVSQAKQVTDRKSGDTQVTVHGGAGADRLIAAPGSEQFGDGGNDVLTGSSADETLDGGPGHDVLTGRGGGDRLVGGPGRNALDGGAGNDTVSYGGVTRPVSVDLAKGRGAARGESDRLRGIENVIGGMGRSVLRGDGNPNRLEAPESDRAPVTLVGRGGGDTLGASARRSRLDSGPGDDTLAGAKRGDVLRCGSGVDSVDPFTFGAGRVGPSDILVPRACESYHTLTGAFSHVRVHRGIATVRVRAPGSDEFVFTLRSARGTKYGLARFSGSTRVRMRLTRAGRRAAARHAVVVLAAYSPLQGSGDAWRERF